MGGCRQTLALVSKFLNYFFHLSHSVSFLVAIRATNVFLHLTSASVDVHVVVVVNVVDVGVVGDRLLEPER